MRRANMLEVVAELLKVLNDKKISPQDAKSIADLFQKSVNDSNEAGKEKYMTSGVFSGSPPKN